MGEAGGIALSIALNRYPVILLVRGMFLIFYNCSTLEIGAQVLSQLIDGG
jgi:hypothetical protein